MAMRIKCEDCGDYFDARLLTEMDGDFVCDACADARVDEDDDEIEVDVMSNEELSARLAYLEGVVESVVELLEDLASDEED